MVVSPARERWQGGDEDVVGGAVAEGGVGAGPAGVDDLHRGGVEGHSGLEVEADLGRRGVEDGAIGRVGALERVVGAGRRGAEQAEDCGEECRSEAQDEVVEASHQELVAAKGPPLGGSPTRCRSLRCNAVEPTRGPPGASR